MVYRAGIQYYVPDALWKLKSEQTDQPNLEKELPVFMINGTEKKLDVDNEYFDEVQSGIKPTGSHLSSSGEEIIPSKRRELLSAQAADRTYTHAALPTESRKP